MDQQLNLSSYLELAESLPLNDDDILFIASDLQQLVLDCRKRDESFDVNSLIESFQKILCNGTIVIPAYTDNLWSGDKFDWETTKPTTGALSNKVFKRTDFVRSRDPLHSVLAWGKKSSDISELSSESTLGKGSIFEYLHQNNAKMICIDVHFQNSFTYVHYVEEMLQVKYRKYYNLILNVKTEGAFKSKMVKFHTKKPWVLTDLYELQHSFNVDGIKTNYQFDQVKIQFFELDKAYDYVEGYIKSGKRLYQIDILHYLKRIVKRIIGKK